MTQSQLRVQQYVSQASNVTNHKNQFCASFLYLILYLFFILIFLELFLCISQFGRSPGVCLINYVTPLLSMHQFKKPTAVNVLL